MKPLLLLLLLGNCVVLCAQTSDFFTDGDFSQNPSWYGDDSLFQVNATKQLQSKGTATKDLSLSTVSTVIAGEWHFWCRIHASPSASNFMRVYLMSDTNNLKSTALNGYYVQLGGVTGSTDSITLYKQKGNTRVRIIGGRPATVSQSNNEVRIKVLRDTLGNWQLFSDTTGGFDYTLEGIGNDNEFQNASFLGLFVRFTSSNALNYYLDEVYAGPEVVDSTAPVLDSIQIISPTQLRLVFNEPLDGSALSVAHYAMNNGMGNPVSAAFEATRKDIVLLTLPVKLHNQAYQLTVQQISDLAQNVLAIQQLDFVYDVFEAQPGNILISEFLPDPTPPLGLPEAEFVELYNNTTVSIQLQGWTISDGTTEASFPAVVVDANCFLIVCANAMVPAFSQYGKTIGLNSWPSLNNTSDQLILKDQTGTIIHHLIYDLSWYQDATKMDGGYSIELMNPRQICKGKADYRASTDAKGGTPGQSNAIWQNTPDTTAPMLFHAFAKDATQMVLVFNEQMDSSSLFTGTIEVSPPNPIGARNCFSAFDSLEIKFDKKLVSKQPNLLTLAHFKDCSGNMMEAITTSVTYFIPDTAFQYDILINEVLTDPDPAVGLPDAEYIELYNRSDRSISLANWTLGDANSMAKLPNEVLLPDSFLVVTALANLPKFTAIKNVIGVASFPSLGNDRDAITLKNQWGNTIHHLAYSDAVFKSAIKKNGGWSLELIDAENPCGNNSNIAPSTDKTGGTPGRKNAVAGTRRDRHAPQLLAAYPLNANTVELRFSEALDSTTQNNPHYYSLNPYPSNPDGIQFHPPTYDKVTLLFNTPLKPQTLYRMLVTHLEDCAGNTVAENDYADFGLPESIEVNDLVINEILFDPKGDGSDFVEVYNRSDKVIDLKGVFIANANEDGSVKDFFPIDTTGVLMLPHSYKVFTNDPINIQSTYTVPQPWQMVQCVLPSFGNTAGTCLLIDLAGNTYDALAYSDAMHYPLLDTKEGVSLERIDFNRPTADKSNWASASSTSGFATPTGQNSQYATVSSSGLITAEPEVFSPDGDGWNDEVHFSYELESSGFTGNMTIFNSSGRVVKQLLRNELLGSSGVFSWNGITDTGEKAAIGIYVCYFEAFNLNGKVVKKKLTTVVGAKL
jgi:hypothetical protein